MNAAQIITDIYLTQVCADNLRIREELQSRKDEAGRKISEYFDVHGGPWDRFNKHRPFVPGVGEKPNGGSFYPADLTKAEWENHLKTNPADRESFESNYTAIKRVNGKLVAVPYGAMYRGQLQDASRELRATASLLPDGNLKKFLELRADAFTSNNYWDSDIAWIDTDANPFEVTIGPYEVYEDRLLGIKAMFEAFIALPDRESTQELQKFSSSVPEFDAILAERLGHKPKGVAIQLEVVADVYRGGESAFGRQFVAYNLPNDRRIHEINGSKKVFSRTMMEAKFSEVGRLIAERVLRSADLEHYKFRNRLLFVLGHELAHGLGPGVRTVDGREVSFEVLLQDLHSILEEAKADMLGFALLNHFYGKGLMKPEEVVGCVVTMVVDFVQEWRTGYSEAHSAGSLIEYNWLKHHDAIRYDGNRKIFDVEQERALRAMIDLSNEFIKIQTDGDYNQAAAFVKQWGFVSPEIPGLVARLEDLPVEVHPVYRV